MYISFSYLMWLWKMFPYYLSLRRTPGVRVKGWTKGRKKHRTGQFFFFFKPFFWREGGTKGSHRREGKRQGGKLQSLVQIELCRKVYLPDQSPCQKTTHLELCTDSDYVIPAISLLCLTIPSNGQYPWLVGCLQNPLHKNPLHPEASSFLLVGYKNRISVINRRVLNTFNHWQGFRKFHSFVMLYLLLSYLHFYFFCWIADFPFSIKFNSGVWAGTS